MMEEELRQLVREQGWNLFTRKRGKQTYFYAQKWKRGEVYLASQRRLPKITKEDVLKKITI